MRTTFWLLALIAVAARAQEPAAYDLVDPDPVVRAEAYDRLLGADDLPASDDPTLTAIVARIAEERALARDLVAVLIARLRVETSPVERERLLARLLRDVGPAAWPALRELLAGGDRDLEMVVEGLPPYVTAGTPAVQGGVRIRQRGRSTAWIASDGSVHAVKVSGGTESIASEARYRWIQMVGGTGAFGGRLGGRQNLVARGGSSGGRSFFWPETQLARVLPLEPGASTDSEPFAVSRLPGRCSRVEVEIRASGRGGSSSFWFDGARRNGFGPLDFSFEFECRRSIWVLPPLRPDSLGDLSLAVEADRLIVRNRSARRTWLIPRLDGPEAHLVFFVWRDETGGGLAHGRLAPSPEEPAELDLDADPRPLVAIGPGASHAVFLKFPEAPAGARWLTVGIGRLEKQLGSPPIRRDERILLGEVAAPAVRVRP